MSLDKPTTRRSAGQKIAAATMILMVLEGVDQGTGLLKQMVIAATFGTSVALDAYLVAATISGLVLLWLTLPINLAVIPMFRHDMAREGEQAAWRNASVLFNNLGIILLAASVAVGLAAPYLVAILAPGFDPETRSLTGTLARIATASVFFIGASRMLSQIYFAYERFARPGLAGTLNNLVFIAAFVAVTSAYGVYGLAIALVVGSIAEFIVQLPILWQKRRFYHAKVDLRHPQMGEMAKLGVPLMLTAGGTEVARVTDRIFASLLPAGSLTALAFAQRLNGLQNDFLVRPLQRSSHPHFSRLGAEGDMAAMSRQLFSYLRLVFFVTLPVTIVLMVLSETIVRLLFQRGAFDESSVRLTGQALLVYTLGFPATALGRVLDGAFFALKNTRTPAKLAFVRIGIKIVLAFLLIGRLSHLGIALAEALSQVLRVPMLLLALPRDLRGQEMKRTLMSLGRTVLAGIAMGLVIHAVDVHVGEFLTPLVEVSGLALLGLAVFVLVALVLLRDELRAVVRVATAMTGRLRSQPSAST